MEDRLRGPTNRTSPKNPENEDSRCIGRIWAPNFDDAFAAIDFESASVVRIVPGPADEPISELSLGLRNANVRLI